MKIVFFVDHLRPYGTQTVLKQLVEGLVERGHQLAVVCMNNSWDRQVVDPLRAAGAEVRIVGKPALISGVACISLWRWLRRERFDVAVTLLFYADIIGRPLARAARIPRLITSLRTRNVHYQPWKLWLSRLTINWADLVILNSGAVRDFAIRSEGVQPNRLLVIYNGVNVGRFAVSADTTALRAQLGLPQDAYLIGSVGRLSTQKGMDLLIRALALLPDEDLRLILVGAGEEEQNLRALAQELGLAERVHFTGKRSDIPQLLALFDLYVHPTRFEGSPNALLEAMAAGRPIIAAAADGVCELIDDPAHGWLVPPESPQALASAIQAARAHPEEAGRRAHAAQQRAREQFRLEVMQDAWERALAGQDR